jgi:gamma-glutamyl-gamma-aminobutyrate hydrolase PuuD
LLRGFMDRGKPVLGICRGAQLINVALGGTLWQDVSSLVAGSLVHYDAEKYDENFHELRIEEDSVLSRLFPSSDPFLVNSIHHQAVRDLGHDLKIEARSDPDGVVEAIRWEGPSYVFGMQWHPEFHDGREGLLDCAPVLEEFLIEALRRRDGH